jgi:hypothetical protein
MLVTAPRLIASPRWRSPLYEKIAAQRQHQAHQAPLSNSRSPPPMRSAGSLSSTSAFRAPAALAPPTRITAVVPEGWVVAPRQPHQTVSDHAKSIDAAVKIVAAGEACRYPNKYPPPLPPKGSAARAIVIAGLRARGEIVNDE